MMASLPGQVVAKHMLVQVPVAGKEALDLGTQK